MEGKRHPGRWGGALAAGVLTAGGALALSDTLFRPMLPPPGDPGLPCRRVSFHSGGVLLSGAVFGEEGRRGCLLLAHGMGVSWNYYLPEIRRFTELGYRVFAFSYRGYPGSGGRFRGFPQAARDVAAAIRFAGDGTLPLILWGHSMGAYAVCAALALTERPVERVVACAPFDDPAEAVREMAGRGIPGGRLTAAAVNAVQRGLFGRDAALWAARGLNRRAAPALILQGSRDDEVTPEGCALYARRHEVINPNVRFRLISEEGSSGHMTLIRRKGERGVNPEVFPLVEAFLAGDLPEETMM